MRPNQDFTSQNLFYMKGRKISESIKNNSPSDTDGWLRLASSVEEQIASGSFRFSGLFPSLASGKPALSTSSASDTLVLRKINDNIRRAYGIRQVQRANAIRLAKTALSEWTPKGVVTLDLKSCFESITPRDVVEKLQRDAKVSTQTIYLLDMFLGQTRKFGKNKYRNGLPRGILISSTLAELYLKLVDEEVSRLPGVYLYLRYVDDIFVMASRSSESIFADVRGIVEGRGLSLNAAKSRRLDVGCACAFHCGHSAGQCPCSSACKCERAPGNYEYLDYLGYRLIFTTGKALKSPVCYAMISKRKVEKIKARIYFSFASYKKDFDFDLLVDRLRYLTSNVVVDRSLRKSVLASGVAYTYELYEGPPEGHDFFDCSLGSLDKFMRTKICRIARLGLSYMQRKELFRHSFVYGHRNRHRATFQKDRILKIKEAWRNVR